MLEKKRDKKRKRKNWIKIGQKEKKTRKEKNGQKAEEKGQSASSRKTFQYTRPSFFFFLFLSFFFLSFFLHFLFLLFAGRFNKRFNHFSGIRANPQKRQRKQRQNYRRMDRRMKGE